MLVTRGFINHRFKPVRTIHIKSFSIAIKQAAPTVNVPNHKLYVPKPRPIATLRVLSNYNKTKPYKQPAENKYDNQYDTDSLESVVEPDIDTVTLETATATPTYNKKNKVVSWRSKNTHDSKNITQLDSLSLAVGTTLNAMISEADQAISSRINDNTNFIDSDNDKSINYSNNINTNKVVTSWRSKNTGLTSPAATLSDIIIEPKQVMATDNNYNCNQVDSIDDSSVSYDNNSSCNSDISNDIIPEAEYYDTSTSPYIIDTIATQPSADTSLDLLHSEGGPTSSGGHNSDDFLKRVRIVNTIKDAEYILQILNSLADKDLIWACDTEVADIDLKTQGPVGNGHVVCVSIYGGPTVDFGAADGDGMGKALWIENLDESEGVLNIFKNWFENESIKKVWHNYGFDRHVLYNHGIDCRGFIGIVYNYYYY